MLVALVLAKPLLLELIQRDLGRKYFDVDAEKLIALLDDVLDDLVVIQGHEEMKSAVTAVSENDSALDVLNAWKRCKKSADSTRPPAKIVKYLRHYL